jgi:hypothetical protein
VITDVNAQAVAIDINGNALIYRGKTDKSDAGKREDQSRGGELA